MSASKDTPGLVILSACGVDVVLCCDVVGLEDERMELNFWSWSSRQHALRFAHAATPVNVEFGLRPLSPPLHVNFGRPPSLEFNHYEKLGNCTDTHVSLIDLPDDTCRNSGSLER